ncbi:MAG: tetratricopeptide repeat protein [Acidobacteriota bacterium]
MITICVGVDAAARRRAARRLVAEAAGGAAEVAAAPAAGWAFQHPFPPPLPPGPLVVWAPEIHDAFVNLQTGNTRLVTTQPAYLLRAWRHALTAHGAATLVATADAATLSQHAPELAAGGLPDVAVQEVHGETASPAGDEIADADAPTGVVAALAAAFRAPAPADRLRQVVEALGAGRAPAALVAAASVCMEVNDLDAALRDLEEAAVRAPDWGVVRYELGKLWLRRDDMGRAAEAFGAAARLLPWFPPAWANLGATLGELDRSEEALAAFEQALALDPDSPQALNNVGVVTRELGRLSESEASFRRVIALVPEMAFGHYNLGHTLFLQGRYLAALSAYVEGQRRDADRNPVQASRLAVCRLATGDAAGARRDLEEAFGRLTPEARRQLAADTDAIVWALVTHAPALDGWGPVHEWLTRQMKETGA